MAEIIKGAAFCWREFSSQVNGAFSLATTPYVRSGHTCLGSPTATVDAAFPLSNLADRRLAKVARIICTPAQDVGSGGNNNWYYPNVMLRWAATDSTNDVFYQNTIGLLNIDVKYPSLEPAGWGAVFGSTGYFNAIEIAAYQATNFTTSTYSKTVGDGTLMDSPRAPRTFANYTFPNNSVRYYTRNWCGSAQFTFRPVSTIFGGGNSNPGQAIITVGRMWLGDALIDADGTDAYWKFRPADPSIVRRSRGSQIYVDQYTRLRSLDFALSNQADGYGYGNGANPPSPYDPSFVIGNGAAPSFIAMQLEAGIQGEVLIQPALSFVSATNARWFGYTSQIYGTIAPPGIEIGDSSGNYSKISGTIIESR